MGGIKNSQVIRQAEVSRAFGCSALASRGSAAKNLTHERLNSISYAGYKIVRRKISRIDTMITDILRLHLTLNANQVSHNSALVNKHSTVPLHLHSHLVFK